MKVVIGIAVFLAVLVLFGWLNISADSDSSSVTIETEKVVDDTEEFVDDTTKVIDDTAEKIGESLGAEEEVANDETLEEPVK